MTLHIYERSFVEIPHFYERTFIITPHFYEGSLSFTRLILASVRYFPENQAVLLR